MRLLGFDITRTKSAVAVTDLSPLVGSSGRGGWINVIREPFTGAWQRNREISRESILAYSAVYACVTLIASDIAKCRICLVEQDDNDIWVEVASPAFSPVLTKPNGIQNRIKFYEQWVVSKLLHGNTYVLKQRDSRNVVTDLYVLNPWRVTPQVTAAGDVYYKLATDNLSGILEDVVVPASEIIHDTMVSLYHPLCGISPLTACGLAAAQGLSIQRSTARLFENGARPGGILTAPTALSDPDADRFKKYFDENFTGENTGKVAVLGGGLKFEAMAMNATDAQLIEQLKWSAETVCSCFHVPPYMVGAAAAPAYNNIEALGQQYYSQCLQALFESIELCLDEGLGLVDVNGRTYGTQFDLDNLLRMDTATQYKAISDGIGGGFLTPNEGRKKLDLKPVTGGDTPYLQMQNFSLAALDKRDNSADPFSGASAKRDQQTQGTPDKPVAEAAKSIDTSSDTDYFSNALSLELLFNESVPPMWDLEAAI